MNTRNRSQLTMRICNTHTAAHSDAILVAQRLILRNRNKRLRAQEHPCDKRRSISEIKKQFPGVDFSGIHDDEDVLWKSDHRETGPEIKVCFAFSLLSSVSVP